MKFRTEIQINTEFPKIKHGKGLYFTGSCFSENIGAKLAELKFDVLCNPFGITYNPASILKEIKTIAHPKEIREEFILQDNGTFFHYDFHSRIHAKSKVDLIQIMQSAAEEGFGHIEKGEWVFITLGTAVIYRLIESGKIVGNCHKQASHNFQKDILRVSEVSACVEEIITRLKKINSTIKICFTVSPVKHLRDSAELNARSKSTLIAAIHETIQHHANTFYFPAFEIMNEDLRDYRFYASDMMHPSEQAINYIFEKFSACFFDDETNRLLHQIVKIQKLGQHRPLHASADANLYIRNKGLKMIEDLCEEKVGLDFEAERKYFYDLSPE